MSRCKTCSSEYHWISDGGILHELEPNQVWHDTGDGHRVKWCSFRAPFLKISSGRLPGRGLRDFEIQLHRLAKDVSVVLANDGATKLATSFSNYHTRYRTIESNGRTYVPRCFWEERKGTV